MALPVRSEVTLRPLGKTTLRPHPSAIAASWEKDFPAAPFSHRQPLGKSTFRPHPSTVGSLLGKPAAERLRRPGSIAISGTRSTVFGPPTRPVQPARGAPGRCRGDDVAEQAQKVHVPGAIEAFGIAAGGNREPWRHCTPKSPAEDSRAAVRSAPPRCPAPAIAGSGDASCPPIRGGAAPLAAAPGGWLRRPGCGRAQEQETPRAHRSKYAGCSRRYSVMA